MNTHWSPCHLVSLALCQLLASSSSPPAVVGDPSPAVVLVVVGAEGTPEYGRQFRAWAERWQQAASRAGATVYAVGLDPSGSQPDRDKLRQLLEDQPRQSAEPLWLVLIGHGTFDGNSAKFNLRGPDVTADALAQWLAPFARPVALVNCASGSGPFINRLSASNRVVVTATKSGYELNFARFGDYLSTAIAGTAADLDKDSQTSLLEAFLWASGRVAEFYDGEGRLATETALLDDNGDGQGTPASWFRGIHAVRRAKAGAAADGTRAHQFHLLRTAEEARMPPSLRARRDELERAIEDLRTSKDDNTDEDAYYARLEPLMLELARLYAESEKVSKSK